MVRRRVTWLWWGRRRARLRTPRRRARRPLLVVAGVLLSTLLAGFAGASPGGAAAPWLTIVYGDYVEAPILIRGGPENHAFGLALGPPFQPGPEALLERPSLTLAHYAGAEWAWLDSDDAIPDIADATYYGRLFLAVGDQPAIVQVYESGGLPDPVIETTVTVRGEEVDVLIGRRARPVGAEGLAVLERHGGPTSADQIAAASRSAGEPGALVTAVVIGLVSAMIISARAATGGIRRISWRSA